MTLALLFALLEYAAKGTAAAKDIIQAIRDATGASTVEEDNQILDDDAVRLIAAIVKAKADSGGPTDAGGGS